MNILVLLIFSCQSISAQKSFSYNDQYGNLFIIPNLEKIPAEIDTTFIKSHLTGRIFQIDSTARISDRTELLDTTKSTITDIEMLQIDKYNYSLRLCKSPKTNHIEELVKSSGFWLYKIHLKYQKDKPVLDYFEFLGFEITSPPSPRT